MSDDQFPRHPHPSFSLVEDSKDGAFSFFRPTIATFHHKSKDEDLQWKARDQRKGRHNEHSPKSGKPRGADTTLQKLARMTVPEYWNISWWVAVVGHRFKRARHITC